MGRYEQASYGSCSFPIGRKFLCIQRIVEIHFVPLRADESGVAKASQVIGNSAIRDVEYVSHFKHTQSLVIVLFEQPNNPLPGWMSKYCNPLCVGFCLIF